MNNVVIIGAGQCGRGYLARFIPSELGNITFIDKDVTLIEALKETNAYQISFCGQERKPILISDYQAYAWEEEQAVLSISKADYVLISIGEQNLKELLIPLAQAIELRVSKTPLFIITAENGTSPRQQLLQLESEKVRIGESVIFCTTLKGDGLSIISENLDYLPYDVDVLKKTLPFPNMIAQKNFKQLLERKIYTYNCLSACVAYPAEVLQYSNYATAANDESINFILQQVGKSLTNALSQHYNVTYEEQKRFTEMAIKKFQNMEIIDTVERNSRAVKRKLGKDERIFAPIQILRSYGEPLHALLVVLACAIWYALESKSYEVNGEYAQTMDEILSDRKGNLHKQELLELHNIYDKIKESHSIASVLKKEE